MKIIRYIMFIPLVICFSANFVQGATKYIRQGANGSGTSWTDAYGSFDAAGLNNSTSTSPRGNTYYVADGSYSSITFRNSKSGSEWIIIIKATETDHGSDVGWNGSYGDGQAVLGSNITFLTDYILIDGNGTHTTPSDNTNDYGFKISSNTSAGTGGIIAFGLSGYTVSNITMRYVHVYNTTNGAINNGTVGLRYFPGAAQQYIKVQNCFLENSGKDGIQISDSRYLLFERNYIKRYGKLEPGSPDYHGQTVQLFYGADDIIFRWNIWESNEGQGLIQIAGIGDSTQNVRFYGNLVFNKTGQYSAASGGFNSSGGIIGDAWSYNTSSNIYVYNNTVVNVGGSYQGYAHFPMNNETNERGYNNLFYACGGTTGAVGWATWAYNASGGGGSYGGTNEQTGLSSSIFVDYNRNDFRLASATNNGYELTSESWWDESDSFFEFLDSNKDMNGKVRGADGVWDRGAYEYSNGIGSSVVSPTPPKNLRVMAP